MRSGAWPAADLVSAVDDLVAACFSDANGVIQPTDLALISFSVQERQSDVLLGRSLPPDPASSDVREAMSEQFRQGDFTGGVEDAIAELGNQIDAESPALPADSGSGAGGAGTTGGSDASSSTGGGQPQQRHGLARHRTYGEQHRGERGIEHGEPAQ